MTLVMSTHNLGQAKRLATRVVYLDAARSAPICRPRDFFGRAATSAPVCF